MTLWEWTMRSVVAISAVRDSCPRQIWPLLTELKFLTSLNCSQNKRDQIFPVPGFANYSKTSSVCLLLRWRKNKNTREKMRCQSGATTKRALGGTSWQDSKPEWARQELDRNLKDIEVNRWAVMEERGPCMVLPVAMNGNAQQLMLCFVQFKKISKPNHNFGQMDLIGTSCSFWQDKWQRTWYLLLISKNGNFAKWRMAIPSKMKKKIR